MFPQNQYRYTVRLLGKYPVFQFVLVLSLLSVHLSASGANSATGKQHLRAAPTASSSGTMGDEARWDVIGKTGQTRDAFIINSWSDMTSGRLRAKDYQPVSPPDMAAALGLATVYAPNSAGWFLDAGLRLHVTTTEGGATYSYESLAKMGWAVGVPQSKASARVVYGSGSEAPMPMDELVRRAAEESGEADAWMVAGQVEYSRVTGETLRRSPSRDGETGGALSTAPTGSGEAPGLLVALVVKRDAASETAQTLRDRIFPANGGSAARDCLIRAYYALFRDPAPQIDPGQPFQSIWRVPMAKMPKVSSVGQALQGTRVRRANLSVWAIGSIVPYNLYPKPNLADVVALDPTIRTDQRFATTKNPFKIAVYPRPRFLLRRPVAEAIVRVNAQLRKEGYNLKLYDAYRPLSVTQRLYHLYQNLPVSGDKEHRYLAVPNVGSRHNRGAAVDCTITDMQGNEIEMPSDYLVFDTRADLRSNMTPAARKHLAILAKAMTNEGFTRISDEWWHFDAPKWTQYRVMDVPFWPGKGEEDVVGAAPPKSAPTPQEKPEEVPTIHSESAPPSPTSR